MCVVGARNSGCPTTYFVLEVQPQPLCSCIAALCRCVNLDRTDHCSRCEQLYHVSKCLDMCVCVVQSCMLCYSKVAVECQVSVGSMRCHAVRFVLRSSMPVTSINISHWGSRSGYIGVCACNAAQLPVPWQMTHVTYSNWGV
jgi:hypothetical protein